MNRIVCWFSCGVASATAAKLVVDKYGADHQVVVVRIHLQDEHPDSLRFTEDCEKWIGQKFITLQRDKYNGSVDTVIEKFRYMSGPSGARCTKELKKQVRLDWQRPDDIHVFGMTADEAHRIDNIIDTEADIQIIPILLDEGLTKQDCFRIVKDAGIEIPMMYKLGFNNNNCIGCLKATSAGYWNHVRKHFPDVFAKRAEQGRLLNVAPVRMSLKKVQREYPEIVDLVKGPPNSRGDVRIPLRHLPEDAGKHESIYVGDCGFTCEMDVDRD